MSRALPTVPTSALADWDPCGGTSDLERAKQLAARYHRDTWSALEILSLEEVSATDRLWVVLREELLPASVLRLCAADYAERALLRERAAGREPAPAWWAAIDVARRYAVGDATEEDLAAARDSAGAAIATRDATRYAAWAADRAGADRATRYAAWDAAGYAAMAAWAARDAEARAQVAITIQRALEWAGAPEVAS